MKVCKNCGDEAVFYKAYIDVNDPSNILTDHELFCDICSAFEKPSDIEIVDKEDYDYDS